jgi:competence ComEA-like helix-hairpin-helix protein
MKKEWIELIKDYIVLEQLQIDINTASSVSFQKVNGIGEKISNRIIKFRNSLGGFYSVGQLSDVYGIDSAIFIKNHHLFILDTPQNKIDVNQSGLKKMLKHPLLSLQQSEEIIKIRSVYGKIDSLSLKNIFTSKEWSEVKNYLKWEN